jgi:hypothetical protein
MLFRNVRKGFVCELNQHEALFAPFYPGPPKDHLEEKQILCATHMGHERARNVYRCWVKLTNTMHWLSFFIRYARSYMFRHPCAIFRELLMSLWVTWRQNWLCCLSCTVNVGGLCALVVVVSCVMLSSWARRHLNRGQDSSVGIATRCVLDGPGFESRLRRDFPQTSRTALGPTQPPIQWVPVLSRGRRRPGRSTDHPPNLAPRLRKE